MKDRSAAALEDLAGDYRYQADFVIGAAWRLMAMQDRNTLSPSFGCFHYAYWRDKTSEFPDARFQEAGATLALLSLPAFDAARRTGGLAPAAMLYDGFAAALEGWARQQNADGSFDEWYKGERGYAATAFTSIAFGLAARCLGDALAAADRARLLPVLARAARWLTRRRDRVKANHEAAGAAALALAAEATGDASFRRAAKIKLEDTLGRQNTEGWFPEIGGMDLGYCSVLLDYVMLHAEVTGDAAAIPAMQRLLAFMAPLLHPDGTISPEMGLCLNPYVSRLGLGLMSPHDPLAAQLVAHFARSTLGHAGLSPILGDDLRLARWSSLPLITALLAHKFRAASGAPFAERLPQGWTWREAAAVGAWHGGDAHVYVSAAGGGVVRAFAGERLVYEDLEVTVGTPGGTLTGAGYDPARAVTRLPGGVRIVCPLGQARFVFPGALSRLVLRLGCSTAWGARLMRWLIDAIRLRRRTASNQSAAPVAARGGAHRLERSVAIMDGRLDLHDRLLGIADGPEPDSVTFHVTVDGSAQRLRPERGAPGELRLARTVDLAPEAAARLSCHTRTAQAQP